METAIRLFRPLFSARKRPRGLFTGALCEYPLYLALFFDFVKGSRKRKATTEITMARRISKQRGVQTRKQANAATGKRPAKEEKPKTETRGRKPTPIKATKRELQRLFKENRGSVNALAKHYGVQWVRMKRELEDRGVI